MSQLHHADSFRDLVVYQRARYIAQIIFRLSMSFPKEEAYSLTDQIRRAARSIGAQIAEAWGVSDADAEQLETQHWSDVAFDCGYLTSKQRTNLVDTLCEIGRMLHSMIAKSRQCCGELTPD
jgi:four helix bundle protein